MSEQHVISGLRAEIKQFKVQYEKLQAENKRLKEALETQQKRETCMCMDCGKVIKTTEQSKHLKECPDQVLKGKDTGKAGG